MAHENIKAQIQQAVVNEFDGAWVRYLLPALELLPADVAYEIYDPESCYDFGQDIDYACQHFVSGEQISQWSQEYPDSGYGDLAHCTTEHGPGLVFSFGGSPGNSAFTVWVVPLAAIPEDQRAPVGYFAG